MENQDWVIRLLKLCKKVIDDNLIPILQQISWNLDTRINEKRIEKMLADLSQSN